MHSSSEENKVENNKKSPSNEFDGLIINYGFEGVIKIFHQQEIDIKDWIIEPIHKERGGMEFMLPNAEGEIYLTWGDLYSVNVTFIDSKINYNEVVIFPTLCALIEKLEEQRERTVGTIRDMLFDAFNRDTPPREDGNPF